MPTLNFAGIYALVAITLMLFMVSYMFAAVSEEKHKRSKKNNPEVEEEASEPKVASDEDHPLDEALTDHSVNLDDEPDDSAYETKIMKRLSDMRINVYYSNYTSSNVLVNGRKFNDRCVEIASNKATADGIEEKSIAEWEDSSEYGIRYAFRAVVAGTNFLIWGDDREDAFINLVMFAAEFDCNYS